MSEKNFRVQLHPFTKWAMGRYARFRNVKYLSYPFFLERMVARAARGDEIRLGCFATRHFRRCRREIKKKRWALPIVMNFPDLLTGFMETWPAWMRATSCWSRALIRYEISLPARYDADGALAISDALADYFVERGFSAGKNPTRFITATIPKIFSFSRKRGRKKIFRRSSSCTARSTRIISAKSRLGRFNM